MLQVHKKVAFKKRGKKALTRRLDKGKARPKMFSGPYYGVRPRVGKF